MLAKFITFVKKHQNEIILVIGVILISLLSFAAGYIAAKQEKKAPLIFEEITAGQFYENSHNRSRNQRALFGLEIS